MPSCCRCQAWRIFLISGTLTTWVHLKPSCARLLVAISRKVSQLLRIWQMVGCQMFGNLLRKYKAIFDCESPLLLFSANLMISSRSANINATHRSGFFTAPVQDLLGWMFWLVTLGNCVFGTDGSKLSNSSGGSKGWSRSMRSTGEDERECCHWISLASFKEPSAFCVQPSENFGGWVMVKFWTNFSHFLNAKTHVSLFSGMETQIARSFIL